MEKSDFPKQKPSNSYCTCGNCENGLIIQKQKTQSGRDEDYVFRCIHSSRPEAWPAMERKF